MTVSVRPWEEISADLRRWNMVLTREAADWGDALAAEVARLTAENQRNSERLNELLEELEAENDRLAAVVAAVNAALDQYEQGGNNYKERFISAIAKVVRS